MAIDCRGLFLARIEWSTNSTRKRVKIRPMQVLTPSVAGRYRWSTRFAHIRGLHRPRKVYGRPASVCGTERSLENPFATEVCPTETPSTTIPASHTGARV